MKICPNCGSQNPADVSFCENCGTKLAAAQKPCPQCQTLNPSESRFCENCGYDFEAVKPTPSTKKQADPKPEKPTSSADAPKAAVAKVTSAPSEPKRPVETTSQPTPSPSRSQATPKKDRSKWQWIAGIIVLIIIVGIGAYLVYGHSETKSASAPKRVAKRLVLVRSQNSRVRVRRQPVNRQRAHQLRPFTLINPKLNRILRQRSARLVARILCMCRPLLVSKVS